MDENARHLRSIVIEYYNNSDRKLAMEQLDQLKSQLHDNRITQLGYKEREPEYREKLDAIEKATFDCIEKERQSYQSRVDAWDEPRAEYIHPDMGLLSGMVPLDQKALETLVERHKKNSLMSKAIQKYAADREIILNTKAPTADEKRKAFDTVYGYAKSSVKDPQYAANFMINDGGFDKIYNPIIEI